MRSPLDRVVTIGVVLLLVGGLSGAWGLYLEATDTCVEGQGVTVDRLGANESAPLATAQVEYENLTSAEQRVFRDALTAEEPPVYENTTAVSGVANTVVTYRGDRYRVSPLFENDCPPEVSRIFIVVGGFGMLVGLLSLSTLYAWRELR
jgi:hypothetical protein